MHPLFLVAIGFLLLWLGKSGKGPDFIAALVKGK